MLTQNNIIDLIKQFIGDCKNRNITFDKVYLFGSFAKNIETEDSDIDLALISHQFSYDRFENALLLAPILLKYLDLDAVAFPTEYFEKGDPFIDEIKRTGILIN